MFVWNVNQFAKWNKRRASYSEADSKQKRSLFINFRWRIVPIFATCPAAPRPSFNTLSDGGGSTRNGNARGYAIPAASILRSMNSSLLPDTSGPLKFRSRRRKQFDVNGFSIREGFVKSIVAPWGTKYLFSGSPEISQLHFFFNLSGICLGFI